MNKRIFFLLILCLSFASSFATHVAGGEIFYVYSGPGSTPNSSVYTVTVRLFKECNSQGAALENESVVVGVYNSGTNSKVATVTLAKQFSPLAPRISNDPDANPCLTPPVLVCYEVGTYKGTVQLDDIPAGYTLSWIRYTRPDLNNTSPGAGLSATFTTMIPGTTILPSGHNTSPEFIVGDTVVICKSTSFSLNYGTTDADGDSLAYRFSPAYNGFGGDALSNPNPIPPPVLQQNALVYASPYTGTSPLGAAVTINNRTGIISGVAPPNTGKYVICVVAEEWRNGVLINQHRKDFIVNIANCGLNGAQLTPDIFSCDGFTWTFENQSINANIISYLWSFGDGQTSNDPRPIHTYADSGVYVIKLKVSSSGGCQDSATQRMHVFPGFFPAFTASGACLGIPFQFKDSTKTNYGSVNKWSWNFGDLTTLADSSHAKDTSWIYSTIGFKNVQLIVGNSKGCIDTATVAVEVFDKPLLSVPFKDTLICSIDTLQLRANGIGTFTWSPNYRISNVNDQNPFVNPLVTTSYIVQLDDRGCLARDTIKVNVLDFITIDAGPDTVICLTDKVTFHPNSQALSFRWTPIATFENANIKNAVALPTAISTTYFVTANLGKCQDKDTILVKTVPYPKSNAGPDSTICFAGTVTLRGTAVGSSYVWSPARFVTNPTALVTTAFPNATTLYVFSVYDTLGCPKPGRDSVLIVVRPPVAVFAGNDTSVIISQPLVFQSSASAFANHYSWTATSGLNNPTSLRPTLLVTSSLFSTNTQQVTYKLTATSDEGCVGSDDIVVKIYKVPPTIFVPSAFTPDGDGNNDNIKPILAGMQRLDFFRVYNRYGQLVFETKQIGKGWDGRVGGEKQGSAAYVYSAQALDYNGLTVKANGTFLLIR